MMARAATARFFLSVLMVTMALSLSHCADGDEWIDSPDYDMITHHSP